MKKLVVLLLGLIPFLTVAAQVTITEVFYDTPLYEHMRARIGVDPEGKHHNGEFVELYNNSTLPVDLSGFSLKTLYVAAYDSYVFPENTICKPKDYILVCFRHPNSPEFKLKDIFTGISAVNEKKIFYHSSFVLGNRRNAIILRNKNFEIISYLQYQYNDAKNGNGKRLSVHRTPYLSNLYFSNNFGRIINTASNPFEIMSSEITSLKDALSDFQPNVTNINQSVGEIKTNISTTPSGAANVSIPLTLPTGIAGFNPELSVVYNSQGGLGVLGFRADLSGLSEISRVQENEYFDGKNNLIKFQEGGPYSFDGTRLIRNKNNPSFYETSPIHSYTTIEAIGRSGNNPLYFKVTSKDGTVTEYGSEPSGRVYAKDGVNILSWKVSKVTNLNGNSIYYSYTTDTNQGVYIKEIQYPGNALNIIRFNYINNNYLPSSYYIDGSLFHSKLLLSSITVSVGSSSHEKYRFDYSAARLFRITEFGSEGAKLSLDLSWGYDILTGDRKNISLEHKENNVNIMTGDIDGDGLTEIIQKCNDDNYLAIYHINSNSEYDKVPEYKIYGTGDSSPLSPGGCPMKYLRVIADVNSDGIDEFIFLKREYISTTEKYNFRNDLLIFQYSKSKGLTAIQNKSCVVGNGSELFLINADNDKYADYLIVSIEGRYSLISGKDGTMINGQIPVGDFLLKDVNPIDYNGDGYSEILLRIYDKWIIYDVKNKKSIDFDFPLEHPIIYHPIIADVNEDGLQDIIMFDRKSENKCYLTLFENKGGTFIIHPHYFAGTYNAGLNKLYCTLGDSNGDGLTDIYLLSNTFTSYGETYPTVHFILLKSPDGTFKIKDYREFDPSIGITFTDINQDGILDVLEMSKSNINVSESYNPNLFYLRNVKCNGVEKASFKYSSSNKINFHQPYKYNQDVANRCNIASLKLVSEMNIPNGLGQMGNAYSNMSSYFKYYGGSCLNDGRGFLGFEKSEEVCVSNGNTTKTITETRIDNNTFLPLSQKVSKIINNKLATVSYSENTIKAMQTNDGNDPKKHVAVLMTERNDTSFLDNSIVNTKISYDEYNRINKQTITYDDQSYSATEYKNYSKHWLPLVVTETKKHFQDSNPFVQETKYEYDDRLNLIAKTEFSNTPTPVTTNNEYYDNGLIKSKRTQAEGVESITEIYTYEQEASRYKITKKEALSTTCTYYNLLTGNLEESTVTYDGIVTPHITKYYYNGLGEKTRIVYPDKTEWNKTYRWATSRKAYFETVESETGKSPVTKWYDILGREIYSITKQGDVMVENALIYNGVGQKLSEINCQPKKSSSTNYLYYADGRIKSISTDIGKYIQYSYKNRTTYKEENGKNFVKTVDSWGNILQQTDPDNSTIIHQYCSNGKPRRTSIDMHSVTMAYDNKGNQLKLNDPNVGEVSYTYDAYNRIKNYKDPKGEYNITYDNYGRISRKAYSSGRITDYTYFNSGNGIGLPQSIKVNNGVEQFFSYDPYGRILSKKEKIDDEIFTYLNRYDGWGRQIIHSNPCRFILNYHYDNLDSRLLKVTDKNNKMLWQQIIDIPEIENCYRIGNSLFCTSTTSKDMSQITTRWEKDGGVLLHENSYQLDPLLGNITSRSERYGSRRFYEKFEYDIMDRLVEVSGNTSMQIAFDNRGNITNKSTVGNYLYQSERTHAVTDIENPSQELESKPAQTITYTEFNKIETIKEGPYEMKFVYGPDEQRVKSELLKNNVRIRTIYYGEGYEKQVDKSGNIKEYSYLDTEGGGIFGMAVSESATGNTNLYYLHNDLQGSLIAISNASGAIIERHSYDAWGRRRSPASWNVYTSMPASSIMLRGYIFQEEMPEFGLINLNGRLYDPMLGRMLSPDPYVQNPENSQSYNRYSYCWNNPLKYTDPNGEFFFTALLGPLGAVIDAACWGAVIGGATYTATVALSDGGFKNWNWKTFGKSAGFGALSGAITGGIGQAYGPVGSLGVGGEVLRAYTHGVFQGAVSGLAGGDFGSGFASGGLGSLAGSAFMIYGGSLAASNVGTYAFSGLAGGLGSQLTGGKFLDGMVIGLMNAGLNHAQGYLGQAGARYFANRKAAYRYMSNTTSKKGVETSGWELENDNVIVLSDKGNTRTSSVNSSLQVDRHGQGNSTVKFNGKDYRIYTHVHTHPASENVVGEIGLSPDDAAMYNYIGKPLHVIYKGNVYFAKYNGSIILDDKHNVINYNSRNWFSKKLNYRF